MQSIKLDTNKAKNCPSSGDICIPAKSCFEVSELTNYYANEDVESTFSKAAQNVILSYRILNQIFVELLKQKIRESFAIARVFLGSFLRVTVQNE